jgi:hypothetical protein
MTYNNEKEKLKKEYMRTLRLVLNIVLSTKNKIQATGSLAVPVLATVLELLIGTMMTTKI